MMAAGVIGAPAGFLARISALEREVSFLKHKVEDDARWKHILQNWVLDNFAFDIQGAMLNRHRRIVPTSTTTRSNPKKKSNPPYRGSSSQLKGVKVERVEPVRTRLRGLEEVEDRPEESFIPSEEQCDDDVSQGFMEDMDENDGVMKDLIITPDICADNDDDYDGPEDGEESEVPIDAISSDPTFVPVTSFRTSEPSNARPREKVVLPSDDSDSSDTSSSEEQSTRRPHRKMDWLLVGSYPNLETMKSQFNLRAWALSTKHVSDKGAKMYYYCKECRKHGPGRLQIRYLTEDSEVEVLKNQLEHDHSTKRRLSEDMKVEIMNLYNAGMLDAPKILAAIKISKPEMRLPTLKQICNLLKPIRKLDRKKKMKEKKKIQKEKERQKGMGVTSMLSTGEKKSAKKKKKDDESRRDLTMLPQFPQTSTSSSVIGLTPQQQQQLSQFVSQDGQRDFQRPHIVAVSGFPPGQGQQLQQFYQQSPFDPGNVHMGQYP